MNFSIEVLQHSKARIERDLTDREGSRKMIAVEQSRLDQDTASLDRRDVEDHQHLAELEAAIAILALRATRPTPRVVRGDPDDPSTWVEVEQGSSEGAGTLVIPPGIFWKDH